MPPKDLTQFIESQGDGMTLPMAGNRHDIYAIGTQEGSISEQAWVAAIKQHTGDNYHTLAVVNLWQIRLVVLVRNSLKTRISHLQTSSVATVRVKQKEKEKKKKKEVFMRQGVRTRKPPPASPSPSRGYNSFYFVP